MPDTPPKESSASVEEQDTAQSPPSNEQNAHQEFEAGGAQDMPMYESEVKEQDRWLPIANGWFLHFPSLTSFTSYATAASLAVSVFLNLPLAQQYPRSRNNQILQRRSMIRHVL